MLPRRDPRAAANPPHHPAETSSHPGALRMSPSTLSVVLLGTLAVGGAPANKGQVDYLNEVKPILAARCFSCHGAIKQKGGLRVDTAAFLKEGGTKGSVVIPGKSQDSLLIKRLLGQDGLKR